MPKRRYGSKEIELDAEDHKEVAESQLDADVLDLLGTDPIPDLDCITQSRVLELACLNLNKDIKKILNGLPIEECLFGGERIETKKILERSRQKLKASLARSKMTRKPLAAKFLNYKNPLQTRPQGAPQSKRRSGFSRAPHYHASQQRPGADRRSLGSTRLAKGGGYTFLKGPRQGVHPKQINWSSKELELLQAFVSKLLEMGAISEVRPIPKIDLFATRINTKSKIFVSWLRYPEAYAVDAFTVD
ncbi:hypothetical protein ILUMI_23988 [Ignelater luminosus]|uniref:Uncharacterized protein n=1 Tax=Ignelater luminosus TaxID=2038154 RepID=A0A8K0CDI6_IGNLU|nr:hypothetical protein ILUMI_23988 [Ignelater luminosus]